MVQYGPPTRLRQFDLNLLDEASQVECHIAQKLMLLGGSGPGGLSAFSHATVCGNCSVGGWSSGQTPVGPGPRSRTIFSMVFIGDSAVVAVNI